MAVKSGYRQTEVGVIPEDWSAEPLGPHIEINSGESPSRFRFENDGIPYFKVEQLNNDSKYLEATPYFIRGEKKVIRGSLIFPKRGASIFLNKIRILKNDSFMDTNLMTITSKRSLDNEYLYYALAHIQLWRIADTTSIPQINNKHINPIVVTIPLLDEQRTIARALSDVDALLGALDRLIAKKRDLKQAAMQQLLTGKTRLPGFSDKWEVKQLGNIASLYQPQTISANKFTESGYPVYGANGVVGFYHSTNHNSWQVTVTCRGSTCGTVNRTVDECWITGNAMVLNCDNNGNFNKEFFYYLMLAQDFSGCITGTGQPQIVRGPLSEFRVCLPSDLSEQIAIATILSDIDAELAALEQRRDKTRDLKQAMMQELLTGKTRLVSHGGSHA